LAQRKFWMRWRVRTGYPVAILFIFLASPTPMAILIGALVAGLGLAIRAYASGYLRKDRELATAGPYARTRNPLYLGSAILAAGFVVAGRSILGGVLVGVYFGVFYYVSGPLTIRMPRASRYFSRHCWRHRSRGARAAIFPGRNIRGIANTRRS
jgi:protein-S-isoprenylcysteine O-methyltransferase Ste14